MPEGRKESFMSGPRGRLPRLVCGIITAIIVVALLVIFIIWLAVQPHKPKYYLEHGSISLFNVSNDGFVSARVGLNLTTRNSNKRIGIYYYKLSMGLAYDGEEFAWGAHGPFYQGHKNTMKLLGFVSGDSIPVGTHNARDMNLERQAGNVDVEVRLRGKIRFKVGSWKSGHYHLRVWCRHARLDVAERAMPPTKCKVKV